MNRIILIGNGFDLAHNLNTSYKDFMKYLVEEVANSKSYNMVSDDEINESHLVRFLTKTSINYRNESKKCDRDFIDKLIESNSEIRTYFEEKQILGAEFTNVFFKKLVESYEDKHWSGIEQDFYEQLIQCLNGENQNYSIEALNKDFQVIIDKLKDYLIKIESDSSENLNPANEFMGKMLNLFEQPIKLKDLSQMFLDTDLNDFISSYDINTGVDPLYQYFNKTKNNSYTTRIDYLFKKIEEGKNYKEIIKYLEGTDLQLGRPKSVLLLNFNYTGTATKYFERLRNVDKVIINIHGLLMSKYNPVIFGFGDELDKHYSEIENSNNKDYLKYIKSIRYLETDNYRKMLSFLNSDNFQVFTIGHSCGTTDRTLLNTIFEHSNCQSIKSYYYQWKEKRSGNINDDYSDIVSNISLSFKNKQLLRDRVVNKTYCEPIIQP